MRWLGVGFPLPNFCTYSLHCSSFLGLPYRILIMYLVKPKKGTAMETIGKILKSYGVGLRARQETEEVVETNLLWPAPQSPQS